MKSRLRIRGGFLSVFFRNSEGPDYVFVVLVGCLLLFGLIMLSSASSVISYQKFGSNFYYISHQLLFGALPGLILFLIISKINYEHFKRYAFPLFICSLLLLLAVFIPGLGHEFGGAKRWLNLGFLVIQPSELAKLAFILYMATWLSAKGEHTVKHFTQGFIPFIVMVSGMTALIVLEPDVGTAMVMILIAFTMYFVAGGRWIHLLIAFGGAGILAFILIQTASYRLKRFMTFLHPELDPTGIGYHINQALLAIGSGGWFGRGFGHSRQKYTYLPEVTGDSIFAIIGEELGFIVSSLIIVLFTALCVRGWYIASHAKDEFGKLLVTGIMAWVFFQAIINIGAMISLLPLTGIPLPFVSYGSSSLIVLMAAMGIVVSVSRRAK